jgi:hypothetical protein
MSYRVTHNIELILHKVFTRDVDFTNQYKTIGIEGKLVVTNLLILFIKNMFELYADLSTVTLCFMQDDIYLVPHPELPGVASLCQTPD